MKTLQTTLLSFLYIAHLYGAEQPSFLRNLSLMSAFARHLEDSPSDIQSLIINRVLADDMQLNPWVPLQEPLCARKWLAPVALQYNHEGTECAYATENTIEVCDIKTKKVSVMGRIKDLSLVLRI